MEHQYTGGDPDDLRYLDAARVHCPCGRLAGLDVVTEDAEPLGTVEGVVIDPPRGRLAYLVLVAPGFLVNHRYLLPMADGAVLEDDGRTIRLAGRKQDIQLLPFRHRSIPPLAPGDGADTADARDAA